MSAGTIVEVVCEDRFGYRMRRIGTADGGSYSSWNWEHFPELKKVIRYRQKRPKGLIMLERAIRHLPDVVPSGPLNV